MTRRTNHSGAVVPELLEGRRTWTRRLSEAFPGIRSLVPGEPMLLERRECFLATAQVDPTLAAHLFGRHTGPDTDLFLLAADGGLTLQGEIQ